MKAIEIKYIFSTIAWCTTFDRKPRREMQKSPSYRGYTFCVGVHIWTVNKLTHKHGAARIFIFRSSNVNARKKLGGFCWLFATLLIFACHGRRRSSINSTSTMPTGTTIMSCLRFLSNSKTIRFAAVKIQNSKKGRPSLKTMTLMMCLMKQLANWLLLEIVKCVLQWNGMAMASAWIETVYELVCFLILFGSLNLQDCASSSSLYHTDQSDMLLLHTVSALCVFFHHCCLFACSNGAS